MSEENNKTSIGIPKTIWASKETRDRLKVMAEESGSTMTGEIQKAILAHTRSDNQLNLPEDFIELKEIVNDLVICLSYVQESISPSHQSRSAKIIVESMMERLHPGFKNE